MRILPAIDLLDGKAVRLHQGRYDAVTVYSDDPPSVATRFRSHVDRIHVVDLEGARTGSPVQRDLIRTIAAAFAQGGGTLQVGGGVRTRAALEEYLALGASRVVLGTAAVKDTELVREIARAHPGVVVIAVDAKNGMVATKGWTEVSTLTAIEVVRALADAPIGAVLYTDIARDGTGNGPNMEATAALAAASPFPVIASGGVATVGQIAELAKMQNVESAIVGRAFYDGTMAVDDALHAARSGRKTR